MNEYRATSQPVLNAHGTHHQLFDGPEPLSFAAAIALIKDSEGFRDYLTDFIVKSPFAALRWETPPIAISTANRPFEFVLVNDPYLDMDPEPGVFGPYFASRPSDVSVLAVPNLGGTAKLVVPRQLIEPKAYVHLKVFLRNAPPSQVHALWQLVATTAEQELSPRPLWISTAGGGVSWLHVRLEHEPKYYSYRPYANAA